MHAPLYLIAKHPRAFTQQPSPASDKSRLFRRAAVTINQYSPISTTSSAA
jgi:hypothetical protein